MFFFFVRIAQKFEMDYSVNLDAVTTTHLVIRTGFLHFINADPNARNIIEVTRSI